MYGKHNYTSPRVGPSIGKAGRGSAHAKARNASKPKLSPIGQDSASAVGNGAAHNYKKASHKGASTPF